MKRAAGYLIIGLMLAGCSHIPFHGFNGSATGSYRNKLEAATSALEGGKTKQATTLLKDICAHSSIPGVTDEALFRLSLLQLSDEESDSDHAPPRKLLARLKKEFPRSQWTTLSRPLLELLDDMEELRSQNQNLRIINSREMKNIKGLNESLIKQNRDLQQTIERIKALDLELERKGR